MWGSLCILSTLYKLQLVFLDYGMENKNPIDHVRFYHKENPNIPIEVKKEEV